MEFMKYLILLMFIWTFHFNKINIVKCEEEYCPKNCECDSFEGYNRANCRGQKLISASVEISEYVQILELDENEITVLDNNCFYKLVHITNLSIAYNSIHTIYLNAFSNLKKLKSIDLSYNRLEYINEQTFEYNHQLIEVNLSGNKFMSFTNQPLFISSSIINLILQNSQITHIYPKLFSKMPILKYLDLSENLMITLTVEPFNKLEKLIKINLENNRWVCDKNIENVVKYLKNKQIQIDLNMCHFELRKIGSGMFEKMIIDPNSINNINEETSQTIIESVWKKINKTEDELDSCLNNHNVVYACNLYKQCLKNLTFITEIYENAQNNLKEFNNNKNKKDFFYLINDTHLVFYFGMCIGAALVFIMVACTLCATKICKPKNKKTNQEDINDVVSADEEFQYLHLEQPQSCNTMIPSFVPPNNISTRNSRRQRRRRAPQPPRHLNRSISTPARRTPAESVNDFATFVTRLFERPARHRYYRAFNENTTNLIRRLSRTSLVNNRLSQHFLNETRNRNNNRNQYNNQEIDQQINLNENGNLTELESFIQNHNENNISDNRLTENEQMAVEEYPIRSRSETPPPPYKEVVKC